MPRGGDGWRGKAVEVATEKTEIHDLRERVSALEAHMSHVATKAWVLAGVVGGMGLAATLAVTVAIAVVKLLA